MSGMGIGCAVMYRTNRVMGFGSGACSIAGNLYGLQGVRVGWCRSGCCRVEALCFPVCGSPLCFPVLCFHIHVSTWSFPIHRLYFRIQFPRLHSPPHTLYMARVPDPSSPPAHLLPRRSVLARGQCNRNRRSQRHAAADLLQSTLLWGSRRSRSPQRRSRGKPAARPNRSRTSRCVCSSGFQGQGTVQLLQGRTDNGSHGHWDRCRGAKVCGWAGSSAPAGFWALKAWKSRSTAA